MLGYCVAVVEPKKLAKQGAIVVVAAAGLVATLLIAWVFVTMIYLNATMR